MNPTCQTAQQPFLQPGFFQQMPQREGPTLLNDVPMEMLTPLDFSQEPDDACALLGAEIAIGSYENALSMIQQDKRPPWRLQRTGITPLHMLSTALFTPEEIHTLHGMLLKKGYNPLVADECGTTYLIRLINRSDIPPTILYLMIQEAWKVNPDILLPMHFIPIFQSISESPTYSFEEKRYLILSITGIQSEEEACRCLNDCLMEITHRRCQFAAIKVRIILNLLDEKQTLHHFKINWYQDAGRRNLIQIVLLDHNASANELHLAIKALVSSGCDINHLDARGHYPLLSLLKSEIPYEQKKWLAERLIELKAKRFPLFPGTTQPAFISLMDDNLENKTVDELAVLTYLLTGRSYYQEFFFLTLLANLFSIDFQWNMDGFSLLTGGLQRNETQIANWLEKDSFEFYSALITPHHLQHPLLWKQLMAKLPSETAKAVSGTQWNLLQPLLLSVRDSLSTAFLRGRDRKNGLYIPSEQCLVAYIATTPSAEGCYHDIGIAFKNSTAYLCNKGFGSLESGVSGHSMPARRFQQLKRDIDNGMTCQKFIDHYFPTRSYGSKIQEPLIFAQKKQRVGNCPIASYTSLEMATLYAALEDIFGKKSRDAAVFARAIKELHRDKRRETVLKRYFFYHSVYQDIPINSNILTSIGRKTARNPSQRHLADIIVDKTRYIFPALSSFIVSLMGLNPNPAS